MEICGHCKSYVGGVCSKGRKRTVRVKVKEYSHGKIHVNLVEKKVEMEYTSKACMYFEDRDES